MAKELNKELENEEMEGTEENLPEEVKKAKKTKKPGRVRKFFSGVWHGVKDNPVTAVVCTGIGVVGTLAAEAAVSFFRSRKDDSDYSDSIEIDDLGETDAEEEGPVEEEAE